MRFFWLLYLMLIMGTYVFSVELKVDSLKNVIAGSTDDTLKIKRLIELGDYYERALPDSAIFYYGMALDLAKVLKARNYEAKTILYLGIIEKNQGNYMNALGHYKIVEDIYEELNDLAGLAKCYSNIGNVNILLGNADKAIGFYMKALVIYEEQYDRISIAKTNINIGNIHLYQENYLKSLEYFNKSLLTYQSLLDVSDIDRMQVMYGISYCYGNMGIANLRLADNITDMDSARVFLDVTMEYYNKSLEICETFNDIHGMANCYTNIGVVNWRLREYNKSIEYYKNALKMRQEIGDKPGVAMVLGNLAYGYITLSDSVAKDGETRIEYLNDAVNYGLKSLELATSINAILQVKNASGYLMSAYKKLGLKSKALEYSELYIEVLDSLNERERTKAITEIEAKYLNEKQLREIERLESEKNLQGETIARQEAENKKQRFLIYSFVIGFFTVVIFSILLYRVFLQKRRANLVLAEQNEQIKQQKEEIEAHRDEIENQRDIASRQRDLILDQKKEITDSIKYAFKIQSAVIPDKMILEEFVSDYFIYYQPRDIVSGDFYWFGKIEDEVIVIAADCTGHGVPGAFMSMLGVAYLNEIINKERISCPAVILNRLREQIIKALGQHGNIGDQHDGMDMSVISIDKCKRTFKFAGANNPIYLVRDGELIEQKGDKMPVAFYYRMEGFTVHEYPFIKGDVIYMFTDGFADQFGGEKGKKYKYDKFKGVLRDNHNAKCDKQVAVLKKEFDDWKGSYDQVDDILVIGLLMK